MWQGSANVNRTDRLLAIVLELQAHGRRRAADLAATFEISKRTVYRDIEALCEAGVPVVAVPGQGYRLVPGYFLPPLSFSPDEATLLLLGSAVMGQSFDAPLRAVADSAAHKIATVLPPRVRDEVRYFQSSIAFVPGSAPGGPETAARLGQLRRAVVERRQVEFQYHARHGDAALQRQADPYGLVHVDGNWYVTAYCHTRAAVRNFRLDRMADLMVLAETFTRPSDFQIATAKTLGDRPLLVRVLFLPAVARWVREARQFFTVEESESAGGLLVTLRVREESDLVAWLLSWGSQVRVLEPASLRERLATEAEKMAQIHRNPDSLLT